MINEYDKQVNNLVNQKITHNVKGEWFIVLCLFLTGISILSLNNLLKFSIIIKLIYTIPLFISGIYFVILEIVVKSQQAKNKKSIYRYNINSLIMLNLFLINGTVLFQMVLFPKWGNKEYILVLLLILICSSICVVIAKFDSPNKFIYEFVYSEKKYKTVTKVSNSILIAAILIANITKPYRLLLLATYVLVIIIFQLILYVIYKYCKYDYIEELKNKNKEESNE